MTKVNRNTIVILCPKVTNDPTQYTWQWAQKAIKMSKDLGYDVKVLEKDKVTYKNVIDLVKKYRPRVLASFSHGCPSSIQGQKECVITKKFDIDTLLDMALYDKESFNSIINPLGNISCPGICSLDNDICNPVCLHETNLEILKDTIVVAVACHSASKLGNYAIDYGAEAYIGYNDLLLFPVDSMKTQDLFGEIHVELLKGILMGKTIEESNEIVNKIEDGYIKMYKEIKYVALPMLWNKLKRTIIGNKEAMVYG